MRPGPGNLQPGALPAQVGKTQQGVEQVVVGGQFQRVGARAHQAVQQRVFLLLAMAA
jgi:hypothetical protein